MYEFVYDGFMKVGTTIPINQARPRLTEILEIVRREPVTITKDGSPVAVVVDPEDYESLLATLEILTSPDLRRQLAEFDLRRDRGELEWVSHEEVERLIVG
ncbi:MAG: type II toxin-antitoxin system Phd/YefM family antitoxin [Chloroflexi bacterium]|nr:MAG: type II toxin-antitoxin system Phd/YefM family antitoxin [Chloroflexota bacterium]